MVGVGDDLEYRGHMHVVEELVDEPWDTARVVQKRFDFVIWLHDRL